MNKRDKDVIGTLALVEGMLGTLASQVKAKTPLKKIDRCRKAASDIWDFMPKPEQKERNQIARKIKRFGCALDRLPLHKLHLVIVSMLIALVDDAIEKKAIQVGTAAKLNILSIRLFTLQKYYDADLKYNKCYDHASWLVDEWEKC